MGPVRGMVCVALFAAVACAQDPAGAWPQHSRKRPLPPVVQPPPQMLPVAPPQGAVVLFDGHDLSGWREAKGSPARWRLVEGGAMEIVAGTGDICTRGGFGDVELHVEWATPNPPRGSDQDRGNSGVFLMQKYEVQVLDSYQNVTYADGQAAAIYGQFPPLVNVSRAPREPLLLEVAKPDVAVAHRMPVVLQADGKPVGMG